MKVEALRTLTSLHGASAWLSVAAVACSAWLIARRRAFMIPASIAAVALMSAASALGLLLHAPYRTRLRQRIFLQSSAMGWLFERKEHLTFGALALAWCTLAVLGALRLRERRLAARCRHRTETGEAGANEPDRIGAHLYQAAVRACMASALLAAAAAAASAIVAHRYSF